MSKTRDTVLDFWRGISVLMVIVHHQLYFHFTYIKSFRYEPIVLGVSSLGVLFAHAVELAGPMGVKFFFIISGFIITKLLILEEEKNGAINIPHFFVRRVFRILPAFLVYLACITLFGLLGWIVIDYAHVAAAMGFVCNLEYFCSWHVSHTWSLSIEEQFYIAWPFLFAFAFTKRRVMLLSGLAAVFSVLAFFEIGVTQEWINNPISFLCITVGALAAASAPFYAFFRKWGLAATCSMLVLLVASYVTFTNDYIPRHLYHILVPFLLLSVILFTYNFKWLEKFRLYHLIAYIGLISYSLYLWQQVFSAPAEMYGEWSILQIPILMLPIAYLSYHYIEMPTITWAKNRLKRTS